MLIKAKTDTWNCQACGEELSNECPAFMFPIGDENYIKICSECENKVVRLRIIAFSTLKREVRPGMWVDNC